MFASTSSATFPVNRARALSPAADRHQWISGRFAALRSGSCQAADAMDAALRCPTSNCGNSSVASLLAEYTEAPASFTMMYCTGTGISLRSCTMICSDHRKQSFPEINVISLLEISFFSTALGFSCRPFWGSRIDYGSINCNRHSELASGTGVPDPAKYNLTSNCRYVRSCSKVFPNTRMWRVFGFFNRWFQFDGAQWQVQSVGCKRLPVHRW